MSKQISKQLVPPHTLERKIHFLRMQKVMLSYDLSPLYAVPVRALIQAVKRNASRFPSDFMFQLSSEESRILRSQSVISSWGGSRRSRPYAFTEQGVAMLSSVLRSERAVQVNIAIIRAFVHLRTLMTTHEDLRRKIEQMEKRYDARFQAVFATLKQMLEVPAPRKREIGFHPTRRTHPG